jgi:hypothetical protein
MGVNLVLAVFSVLSAWPRSTTLPFATGVVLAVLAASGSSNRLAHVAALRLRVDCYRIEVGSILESSDQKT